MKIRRRVRLDHRLALQKQTRDRNGIRKREERDRRDARIAAVIKANPEGPFTPAVASWIADKLGKPAAKATKEDILGLAG
ncbi:MAG: hypothetical protein PF961_06755 [Planctomycetota bacterium]|jgi:hypothetical protein|nr:hypothetical protein [Planctomycetota bacterium]